MPERLKHGLLHLLAAMTLLVVLAGMAMTSMAMAQSEPPRRGPLGVPSTQERAAPAPAMQKTAELGFAQRVWLDILTAQRELQGAMSRQVRQLANGDVLASGGFLALFSFIYGVLHAAGPGHGKFVISSYALANEQTVRRGIMLSFMAALIQALSAIVLVGVLALILNAANVRVRAAVESWLEAASWLLVAMIGGWLLWRQITSIITARRQATAPAGHSVHGHDHLDHHDHDQHGQAHSHAHAKGPAHGEAGHVHDASCGHVHLPPPSALAGAWSWREAWAMALSIGIRPCTGAIGVLIFAGSIGIFWAGVFATFAMALGTALTVSSLAAIAVGSRNIAARIAGRESRWGLGIQQAAGVVGASLVLVMGLVFFAASLSPSAPF